MATDDYQQIELRIEADIVTARQAGRVVAKKAGFRAVECAEVAAAISELARNIILYAGQGTISIRVASPEDEALCIEIIARDSGPGIEDIDLVMRDGYTTSNGLGLGLPGTRRIVDDFELSSKVNEGTVITIRKWLNKPRSHRD